MSPYFLILAFVAVVTAQDPPKPAEPEAKPEPKPRVQGNCANLYPYDFTCNVLANDGHCDQDASKVWMSKMCSKACNTCDATKHEVGKDCDNRHPDAICEAWAAWGKCQIDSNRGQHKDPHSAIHRLCAKSCNSCKYLEEQLEGDRRDWLPLEEETAEEPTQAPPAQPSYYQYLRRYYYA